MKQLNKILVLACIGSLLPIAGCDDSQQASAPTSRPAAIVSTTQLDSAAANVPTLPPSIFTLDGRDVIFPGAKLAVISHGTGGYTLRLCSDDPPTAIDPGYSGNSYVLDMQMGIDHLSDLPNATWDCKPSDSDDTASGVYLHGCREQYRPRNVHVTFQKTGDELLVYVTGEFLHSDQTTPATPPDRAQISGCLRTNFPSD